MAHTQASSLQKSKRLSIGRQILAGQGAAPRSTPSVRFMGLEARFVAAARNYRRCVREYTQATGAWQAFSATHPADDPAHAEHHMRVVAARMALNGADEAFAVADQQLMGGGS